MSKVKRVKTINILGKLTIQKIINKPIKAITEEIISYLDEVYRD